MTDLLNAEFEASRLGLTTLHCILSSDDWSNELNALLRLKSDARLSLRYRVFIPPGAADYVRGEGLRNKLNNSQIRIAGVKIFADGSLGARTAALREPYSDDPTSTGVLRYTDESLSSLVTEMDEEGYQVIIHAIGDRAVEQSIEALARVTSGRNPRRHRIEHASLAPADLRTKISKHKIGVTVQPHFVVSDAWAMERLGHERVNDLYPFRSMLREGIMVSGGSDAPVENQSPIIGLWAAMTPRTFAPNETLTLEEAVKLYTVNAAFNGFDDSELGQLREGYRADVVLLDSIIAGMHPALLRKVRVATSIVNGVVIHSSDGSPWLTTS